MSDEGGLGALLGAYNSDSDSQDHAPGNCYANIHANLVSTILKLIIINCFFMQKLLEMPK